MLAVNFLITHKKVKSKTVLAENIRVSKTKLSEILSNRMNVGSDTLFST